MHVHILHFSNTADLMRCFSRLGTSELVEDLLVDSPQLRIRFLAPADLAHGLIERIYLDGGLTWCSRSEVLEARVETRDGARPIELS